MPGPTPPLTRPRKRPRRSGAPSADRMKPEAQRDGYLLDQSSPRSLAATRCPRPPAHTISSWRPDPRSCELSPRNPGIMRRCRRLQSKDRSTSTTSNR
jgi:hypothetical protein